MKLCFISDFYAPSIGGTQILARQICEGFLKRGHQVEVITTPDIQRKQKDFNYRIHNFNNFFFSNNNILLEKNYDSIFLLADLFSPTLSTIEPAHARNSILILNLDENVYRWYKEGKIANTSYLIEKIKKFDSVVSFCEEAPVNKFLQENKIPHTFVPNFSRDTQLTVRPEVSIKEKLGIQSNKKIIFNHGLIEERKNQLSLCQAAYFSGLLEDYVLILLGSPRGNTDEAYFNKINYFIESNNLEDKIKIIKGTTNKGIIDLFLTSSDIFILPSKAEGLPLVLLEAMSSNLPWISTPVGGVPKVFGNLKGGKVLEKIEFSPEELKNAVIEVENRRISRKEWETLFTEEIVLDKYEALLHTQKVSTKQDKKLGKFSFANQVYNEPEAIKNYLSSCLQFADILDEVFIIDHRSSDKTLEVIKGFRDKYEEVGIKLRWITEKRDFSKEFTIADLFGAAVQGCSNEIVFRHDADFIFGEGYRNTIEKCVEVLSNNDTYACGYEIPVVSEKILFDKSTVTEHGFCKMHVSVPRVFKKSKTKCLQNHVEGKYEWFYPIDSKCQKWLTVAHHRESVLSVNIKDEERKELRKTMNTFFQDLYKGKVGGTWLSNNNLRKEEEEQNREDGNLKNINIVGEKYDF